MRRSSGLAAAVAVSIVGLAVALVANRPAPGNLASVAGAHGPPPSTALGSAPPPPSNAPAPSTQPSAQPFVHTFAALPGVPTLAPVPSPTAILTIPAHIDGCDHNYGRPGQCVPWAFPPGTTDRCAWLRAHGLTLLPVVGADRQGLDPNRDGVACGPGDS